MKIFNVSTLLFDDGMSLHASQYVFDCKMSKERHQSLSTLECKRKSSCFFVVLMTRHGRMTDEKSQSTYTKPAGLFIFLSATCNLAASLADATRRVTIL